MENKDKKFEFQPSEGITVFYDEETQEMKVRLELDKCDQYSLSNQIKKLEQEEKNKKKKRKKEKENNHEKTNQK